MVEKCPAKYKNLNLIQSFSEQAYATVQWCQQNCENDEWLKRQVDTLKYLSPPSIGKWNPIKDCLDESQSYGCQVVGDTVQFSKVTEVTYDIGLDSPLIEPSPLTTVDFHTEDTAETENENFTVDNETGKVKVNNDWSITINSAYQDSNSSVIKRAYIPSANYSNEIKQVVKRTTKSFHGQGNEQTNSGWYIGYDKTKNYYIKPEWLKKTGWKSKDIPSVARAQTFLAKDTGKLIGVDLKLYCNGLPKNYGSPLYVQLWKTKKQYEPVSAWDDKNRKMVYQYEKEGDTIKKDENGKPIHKRELVYVPDTTPKKEGCGIYHPLASAEYDLTKMKSDLVSVMFDSPYKVQKGNTYALVLFSPLSEWGECPMWGGWGRNCHDDSHYSGGYAFVSENNGRTWKRYGRNDVKLDFKMGKYVPQDYGFKCQIETTSASVNSGNYYVPNKDYYLYLKPFYTNPISHIRVSASTNCTDMVLDNNGNPRYTPQGATANKDFLTYEYSLNGRDWISMRANEDIAVSSAPDHIFVRFVFRHELPSNSTEQQKIDNSSTPYIEDIHIYLKTKTPTEMYATTTPYAPPTTPMLGANIWGKLYAPFTLSDTVKCTVDIIEEKGCTENFTIIDIENVETHMMNHDIGMEYNSDGNYIYDNYGTPKTKLYGMTDMEKASYLTNHTDILKELKDVNVFVKPIQGYTVSTVTNNGVTSTETTSTNKTYMLSFAVDDSQMEVNNVSSTTKGSLVGGISLGNDVAYNSLDCKLTPSNEGSFVSFNEWYDFEFDYENNILRFYRDRIENIGSGTLQITYNPLFITGLTQEEVGLRETTHPDSEVTTFEGIEYYGLNEMGLVLDYFKETFTVTDEDVKNRYLPLRAMPVDPIKEVLINPDTDDEMELYEYRDFTVDQKYKKLNFIVNNTDGVSTLLNVGDTITVVYTPNLKSSSIRLGYHATREDTSKTVTINDYYVEYKS